MIVRVDLSSRIAVLQATEIVFGIHYCGWILHALDHPPIRI